MEAGNEATNAFNGKEKIGRSQEGCEERPAMGFRRGTGEDKCDFPMAESTLHDRSAHPFCNLT